MSDSLYPSAMLAAPFTWTSSAPDLVLTFPSGASPVNVNVASGSYRILLAPSSGSTTEFLAAVQTAINAALSGAGRSETVAVTMRNDGYVLFTVTGGSMGMTGIHSTALGALLGFTDAVLGTFITRRGERHPRHVALLCGQTVAPWVPSRAQAVEMTEGGTTYGVVGDVETHDAEVRFSFIPDKPALTSDYLTPWAPIDSLLVSVGSHSGVWSVRDMLRLGVGQTWGYAHDYQAVRQSTSERFDLVTVPPETLRTPRIERTIPDVIRYTTWSTKLVRVSPYTTTRA